MQSKIKYYVFIFSMVLFRISVSFSQVSTVGRTCEENDCQCGRDITPSGIMLNHMHAKGEWMFSYRFMNMGMKGIQAGTILKSKDQVFSEYLMATDKMQMNMHMLMAMYGVTEKMTLMAMLNYNFSSMQMSAYASGGQSMPGMNMGGNSQITAMKSSGFSDLKIYALFNVFKRGGSQLNISTGISLPAGQINAGTNGNASGQRYPYGMQPGSGTWDILPILSYVFTERNATIGAQFLSIIRTGYNKVGYKLGNEAMLNGWFAYRWLSALSSSVRLEGGFSGRIKGNDPSLYAFNEISSNPYNYGGKKFNLYLGSIYQMKKGVFNRHKMGIEYGFPVYQNLNGTQLRMKKSIVFSWIYGF